MMTFHRALSQPGYNRHHGHLHLYVLLMLVHVLTIMYVGLSGSHAYHM